jgi:hypothetical protein
MNPSTFHNKSPPANRPDRELSMFVANANSPAAGAASQG